MYSFKELLNSKEISREAGAFYTVAEIYQQPAVWKKTAGLLIKNTEGMIKFLIDAEILNNHNAVIYITGAGSSEFVGNAVAPFLQKELACTVISVSTTDFITQPENYLLPGKKILVISLGRSGNSPESIATFEKTSDFSEDVSQLVVTCNKEGKLAELARLDSRSYSVILPEETNDVSLVMTSSYSSMALSMLYLAYFNKRDDFLKLTDLVSQSAEYILGNWADCVKNFITKDTQRIQYLGTCELKGAANESWLKVLEMTDGQVVSMFNSYLGLRHGPQVFADKTSLVIAFISSDDYRRRYEIELLQEMQNKEQAQDYLFVCQNPNDRIKALQGQVLEVLPVGSEVIPEAFRVLSDTVVGQLNGVFKSLQLNLKPDNPSISGVINRVVSGVTIY